MCRLLLSDGLKAACTLFWISGFGFRVADRCRLLSRFVARMKSGAKHRLSSFFGYPRHGRRVAGGVQCGYGGSATPCAPSRHAIRHSKSSLHFPKRGAGCFFKFAANLSPLPRDRVRVRAFSDGANFNFCMAEGLPSPTGERVSLRLPSEGSLHLNMTAKCRLPLPRAATLSVGMAAQRHADRSESEIYLIERKCYSGLK